MTAKRTLRAKDYVDHILKAIRRIEVYVNGFDVEQFVKNDLVQDAVFRNLEVIGEAANKIKMADGTFMLRYPHVRLEQAYQMRNALSHGYYSVNLTTVWNTVQHDLPTLKQQMAEIAAEFMGSDEGA